MTIGLDIDNVIADLDKALLQEFLKEDKNKRGKGITNKTAEHITQGMFDWTKEEIKVFLDNNLQQITEHLEVVKDAKKYIAKLREEGNKIYLITGRNSRRLKNPKQLTKDWLFNNDIDYDKLILTENNIDKSKECIENNVDIMFDDRPMNCILLRKSGIESYLFKTRYNYRYSLNVPMINDWKELYELVRSYSK